MDAKKGKERRRKKLSIRQDSNTRPLDQPSSSLPLCHNHSPIYYHAAEAVSFTESSTWLGFWDDGGHCAQKCWKATMAGFTQEQQSLILLEKRAMWKFWYKKAVETKRGLGLQWMKNEATFTSQLFPPKKRKLREKKLPSFLGCFRLKRSWDGARRPGQNFMLAVNKPKA